jgi:hypothetical protein
VAFKYFNVKNGLVTGNILLHASNSSISANAFTGNLNVTSTANLGNVGNVIITGGVANYVLSTDGTGNLNWVAQTGGTATANIQILDEGNILTNSVSSINFVGPGVVANNTGNAVTVTISGGESSSSISNGNSNVTVQANSNVNVSISGIPNILVVSGLGANVTGTMTASGNVSGANLITTGNVFAPAIVQNASTYDTRVSLSSAAGIVEITSNGNSTKFGPSGTVELGGASQVIGGTFGGSGITLGGSQTDIFQNRGGNVTVQTGTSGTISNTWTFAQNGSFTSPGNINASNANLGNSATANYFIGNFYGTANSATTAGTVTTNAQPNITSVGTLTSLAVTGNISSGNANLGNLVTANFFSGDGSLLTGITANAANSNYANFAGTIVTAAQPNITSVGTLTILDVSGNITAANITANTGVFTGNGSGLSAIAGANVTGTVANATFATSAGSATTAGTVTTNAQPNITSVGTLTSLGVTGNVSGNYFIGNGSLLTGVPANTSLINGNSNVVVTLNGNVTVSVSGTANSVVVTSTGINSAGYVNAVGNINGANITGTHYGAATGLTSIPGANVTGTVANATFATTSGTAGTVTTNAQPNITSTGTLSNLVVNGNVVIGGGSGGNIANANVISANTFIGNGSQLTGVLAVTAGTVTTNAQPNITSVGTLTSLGVTGNITSGNANLGNLVTANFFSGNGSLLTGITATTSANANYANFAGTVITNAQPNITSVGTLTSLGVSGNITAANITANTGVFTGNGSGLSAIAGGNVTGTVANATFATTAGTVTTNAQPNITSVGTLSALTVGPNSSVILSGSSGFVKTSSIQGVDGTAAIYTYYGNVSGAVGIYSNLTVGTSGSGNLIANSGKVIFGNVGDITITGGTANYVLSTDGTGNLNWVAQSGGGGGGSSISNGTSNVSIATANGNITMSVGGTSNVFVISNTGVTVSGTSNLGNVGNVKITGGTANYVLSTDGTGNLDWVAQSGGGTVVNAITLNSFTGNGVQTNFTLSVNPQNENYTSINIGGVSQLKTGYSLSGNTIIFSEAPAAGASIEVTTTSVTDLGSAGGYLTRTYTGNGVQNTFAVTSGVTDNSILVMENGIVQVPVTDYSVSGANLIFTSPPANSMAIQVRELSTNTSNSGGGITAQDLLSPFLLMGA